MKIRNVLSLFDGISCGQLALKKVGIEYDIYYASEIDKNPIYITQYNFPKTVQLGDVEKWKEWNIEWDKIDLLIGGSPCTNLSIAGNRKGLEGEESRLFYSYVDILNHIKKFNPQVKFLLENVESMSDENKGIINNYMGCKPVMINSSLVSAQNRKRYYWVNWHLKKESLFGLPSCTIPQPEDKHILLKDILETGVASMDKSITLQATDYKGMGAKPIERLADGHQPRAYACEKVCYAGRIVGRPFDEDCKRTTNGNGNVVQIVEVNSDPNKSNTLSTVQKDNVICEPICVNSQSGRSDGKGKQPFVEDRIYSVDGKAVSLNTNWHQNVAEPVRIEERNNVESFCFKFERTDEGKKLRKDYESGKIHHKFNEHRILTPRTDNKTNTLTTIGKDNLICESLNNYVKNTNNFLKRMDIYLKCLVLIIWLK